MMNERFGERLNAAILSKGLTKYRVAKLAEISEVHIGNLVSGKRPPTPEVVEKIAKALEMPLAEMLAWAEADTIQKRLSEFDDSVLAEVRQRLPEAMGIRGVEIPTGKIPFAGEVGCGRQLILHPEEALDLPLDVIEKGDFAVVARGDSMNKVPIVDGDVLICRRQDWAEDRQIVVANIEGDGSTCKRFRVTQEGPYLVPESYSYGWEPIPVTKDVLILGAVRMIHRPPIELG